MLLKFAGIRKQYAIGMRWAVDDRGGIESIQFNTDLHYGIMLKIDEKISRKLRLVALCDASHNKAICLAGLLASRFKNLILVHRISDSVYWVCVVKNNSVWSGVDVPKATAGDFVGNYTLVHDVVELAKAEFLAESIDLEGVLLSTDTASEDYPDFKAINFLEFVTQLKKDSKYIIRYLQPSKILLRKLLMLVVILIASGIAVYYVQQQRLVTRLLHQQQIEQERQRELAIKAKADYFTNLQKTIHQQVGYAVVDNVLSVLNHIPLQSQGWNLSSAIYDAKQPKSLILKLSRSEFGTLDSFLFAYSKEATNGSIGTDNNTGIKTITVNSIILKESSAKEMTQEALTQAIPREQYRLISYMQVNQALYKFQIKKKNMSQYHVTSAEFEIGGDKLWQLMQFEKTSTAFPTLTITGITFVVSDFDMSWTIEGEIYA